MPSTFRLILACFIALSACGSAPGGSQSPAARPFNITAIAEFDSPFAMAFLPGTATGLVTEKAGRLWLVDIRTGQKQEIGGLPEVSAGGQGGLLDVVASPRFTTDRLVYLTYSEPSPAAGSGLALARARLDGTRLTNLKVLWRDEGGGEGGQFGAIVAFAPDGQSLFLTSGDRQRMTPAQDPDRPVGKILHLTLEGRAFPGNPSHGPGKARAETWSTGHRNPYGLAFDSAGRLWETEMGPRGGDELNLIKPGKNYGWPLASYGTHYDGRDIPDDHKSRGFEEPKLWWNPSVSPTSLIIYSGKLFPQWKGSAFIGALSAEALIRVTFDGEAARKADQWNMDARIRFVGEGPEGAIYLLEDGGRLVKLTPAAAQARR
ncbi:MAG: PQQ-dependent sugar dehydrogenase [Pseudomonadota bacterium]